MLPENVGLWGYKPNSGEHLRSPRASGTFRWILDDIRHDAAASVIDRAWPLSTLRRQRSSDKHLDEDL
jgi:hypothetical protein